MTTVQSDEVDRLGRSIHGAPIGEGVIPRAAGLAQGGYTGGIPLVPETRPYSYPQGVVQIDYAFILEESKRQERYLTLRGILDTVDQIDTKLPGSLTWEDKHISGDKVKAEVLKAIRDLM